MRRKDPNTQRLPGLTERGWRVRDEHPTAGRQRLLLLGAPDVEGGVLLGGLGRAGLPGVALRWWRQRHLLSCLFCRLLGRCPPRRSAAVEELTWAPARPPLAARGRTRPLVAGARGGGGLKDRDQARPGGGSSAAPPRGQGDKLRCGGLASRRCSRPAPEPRLGTAAPTGRAWNSVPRACWGSCNTQSCWPPLTCVCLAG